MIRSALLLFCLASSLSLAADSSWFGSFYNGFSQVFDNFPALPTYNKPENKPEPASEPDSQTGLEENEANTFAVGGIAAGMIGGQVIQNQDFNDFCHATPPAVPNTARKIRVNTRKALRNRLTKKIRLPRGLSGGPVTGATIGVEGFSEGEAEQYHRLAVDYLDCYATGIPPEQGLGNSAAFYMNEASVRERCLALYKNLTGNSIEDAKLKDLKKLRKWHEIYHSAWTEWGLIGGIYDYFTWPHPLPQSPQLLPVSRNLSMVTGTVRWSELGVFKENHV